MSPAEGEAAHGLYVHLPFCVSICPYCDFVVYAGSDARGPRNRIEVLVDALIVEIGLRAAAGGADPVARPLATVYLGGGTPSLLPASALARILDAIRDAFGIAEGAEVTLEANPGPDERGDPLAQGAAGVTRLSLGAQSFSTPELKRLGRRHSAGDIGVALIAAREAGIRSINLDLLYDVPGQTLSSWADGLERAIGLAPEHLSLYALTLDDPEAEGLTGPLGDHLPPTPGARRWRERALPEQDDDRAAAMYHLASHRLREAGFVGYEIANWAQPGHESRHNLGYWERRSINAVGPGAHAFDGRVRRWNAARLDAYVAALLPADGSPASLPPGGDEVLDDAAAAAENLILGLRLDRGVALTALLEPPFMDAFDWAVSAGLLEETDNARVHLTTRGRLLSNELFARLI
ncbi:MAG TPA: radical SAM family heme chaperone HemW [Candidatus Limnocylindrales bacterium]|nr:radical SAM family heme chaperone HemW [Candidatus Limnocylindrales bacterium]